MVPVVFLVEKLALPIDYIIETVHAPVAFGGVIMAVLVATPEAISAVRASIADPAALCKHLPGVGPLDDRDHRAGDARHQPHFWTPGHIGT
jgi:hypothetical protein